MGTIEKSDVDDFVSVKALKRNRLQQGSTRFNTSRAQSWRWKSLIPGGLAETAESGSGPGGRRFKSSLPDHYFLILTAQYQTESALLLVLGR
jgi:hypothetical protein